MPRPLSKVHAQAPGRVIVKAHHHALPAARRPDALKLRLHGADGALLRGEVDHVLLFAHDHRAQLEAVVERHQSAGEAHEDGERPVDEQARKRLAQVGRARALGLGHGLDGAPERRGDDPGRLLERQAAPAHEVVDDVGDGLGIRLERAGVAEHFNEAAVRVVAGDFAVVHHRAVKQREGMRAAPPAGRVGRVAAVRRPAVAGVLVKAVKPAHILREAHGLEDAHVLAAGEDERALDLRVDVQHAPHDVLLLVEMAFVQHGFARGEEVAPDQRLIGNGRNAARGDLFIADHVEVFLQIALAGVARGGRVVE